MMEGNPAQRLDINDPTWDLRDKQAYLEDLRKRGVPAMIANRGKLLDFQNKDRSDLIQEPPANGDLSPMIEETMAATAAHLDDLIKRTHERIVAELECFEGTRVGKDYLFF